MCLTLQSVMFAGTAPSTPTLAENAESLPPSAGLRPRVVEATVSFIFDLSSISRQCGKMASGPLLVLDPVGI